MRWEALPVPWCQRREIFPASTGKCSGSRPSQAAYRAALVASHSARPEPWCHPAQKRGWPMSLQRTEAGKRASRTGVRLKLATAFLLCAASLVAFPVGAAAREPIELAVFEFELEDVSAGTSFTGETPADRLCLTSVTNAVRELLAQSGYRLVDVGSATEPAAQTHTLRDCNGCDAGIALRLGAKQSFVG